MTMPRTTTTSVFYVFTTQSTSSYYRRMRTKEHSQIVYIIYYIWKQSRARCRRVHRLSSFSPPSSSCVAYISSASTPFIPHLAFKTCSQTAYPVSIPLFISFATEAIHLWVNPIIHVSQNFSVSALARLVCLWNRKLSNVELKFSVLLL